MQVYAEMKNSGIPWIGSVPSHWGVHTLYQFASQVKRKNSDLSERNLLSLSYGRIKRKNIDAPEGLLPASFDGYNIIEEGDIVLRLTDLQNDHTSLRVGRAEEQGIITSAYITIRPEKPTMSKFLYYLLYTFDIRKGFYGMGSGVRQGLNYDEVKALRIVMPSCEEQVAIAAYLDEQCRLIDTAIAEAKVIIEEYEAWRASIIDEAVTRGIDPNAVMKASGLDWVGDIPNSWDVIKVTRVLDTNHPYPIGDGDHGLIRPSDYIESGIPYIRVQNLGWGTSLNLENIVYISPQKNDLIKSSTLIPDDVLFAKTGATIGKTGIVPASMPIANTTSHVGKISVAQKYNAKYVFYALSSFVGYNQFWIIALAKTTRPELSIDEIRSIKIVIPTSRNEQDAIVDYLDKICPVIDQIIIEKAAIIDELESYRRSLIYEAVTGKRKVV